MLEDEVLEVVEDDEGETMIAFPSLGGGINCAATSSSMGMDKERGKESDNGDSPAKSSSRSPPLRLAARMPRPSTPTRASTRMVVTIRANFMFPRCRVWWMERINETQKIMISCHQEDERKGRAKSRTPLDVDISTVEYRRHLFIEIRTSLPLGIWPHHVAPLMMHEDDASITITNHFFTCPPLLDLDTPLPLNVHRFLFRATKYYRWIPPLEEMMMKLEESPLVPTPRRKLECPRQAQLVVDDFDFTF